MSQPIFMKFGTHIDSNKLKIRFIDEQNPINRSGDMASVKSIFTKKSLDILEKSTYFFKLRLKFFFWECKVCKTVMYKTYSNFIAIEITVKKIRAFMYCKYR